MLPDLKVWRRIGVAFFFFLTGDNRGEERKVQVNRYEGGEAARLGRFGNGE